VWEKDIKDVQVETALEALDGVTHTGEVSVSISGHGYIDTVTGKHITTRTEVTS
jgi:hypothetical protein